jgi:hypothetical protein
MIGLCALMIAPQVFAQGDAVPNDVVKWRQPPDMQFGVNIQSTEPQPLVADDWRCEDPRPVTDVHFWGSYIGWERIYPQPTMLPPVVDGFWIRIYKDVPAGVDPHFPYSHPGELLFRAEVKEFRQDYVASILHPDETFEHKFYYSLDLPEPFDQEEGAIYWISISAIMPDQPFPWGWETSDCHWNDNAARFWLSNNHWEEITPLLLPDWYQQQYRTVDMAFELTVPYEPPPPPKLVKWQQRPDMVHGINVVSTPDTDPPNILNVADDWLCLDGSPVSDLHFWGSYLRWFDTEAVPMAPPPGVERFRIQVYSDRPAGTTLDDYSRPDKLLYEAWVDTFTESYVASIPVTWPPEAEFEHKFRYDIDLPRMFWQRRDRIYWLNIAAVPRDSQYRWGWESSMDRWNDWAVEGFYNSPDDRFWSPIVNPMTKEFTDMSFELTACQGPIKWLQFPDMAQGCNIPELVVADDWLCREGKPITEVHFWGSYLDPTGRVHWEQHNPGPPHSPLPPRPGVQGFKLSFHKDVPAGVDPDMPWSHPGELLREDRVEFGEVRERYWDSIPHEDPAGEIWWEHKFYYIVRLREPFLQEMGNIYWLDIAAEPLVIDWVWGWETSKDHWNDDAVMGDGVRWQTVGRWGSDFDDLPLGSTYHDGDTFVTSGISVSVKPFPLGSGFTKVVNLGQAGGSGKELELNNVTLDFGFPAPAAGLSLLFGEYGGDLHIEVNGAIRDFENFADINGQTIGGAEVTVVNGFGNDMGSIKLTGLIYRLALGGQELWIDDLKTRRVDMAFLLIAEDDTDYCEGDFNRDGDVDGSDLVVFAADFGQTNCYFTGDCQGDFTYDGDVDIADLTVFAADFGRTDCPCLAPTQACCLPDGTCAHVAPEICLGHDGTPRPGTNCDSANCPPALEACCMPDGTCIHELSDVCRNNGGAPQGLGTNCSTLQCPQPLQACCLPDGSCVGAPPDLCLNNGGSPQGAGTDCATTQCPQPPEACCWPNGSCEPTDPNYCEGHGGTPQGAGTDCSSVECPQPSEACCFPHGICNDLPSGDCDAQGGTPLGPGSNCATDLCPQPDQACCLPIGSCAEMHPNVCAGLNGTPQGPATKCATVTCPQPPEACCLPAGACIDIVALDCLTHHGTPQGRGSNCAIVDCPQPLVACCMPDGSCIDVVQESCTRQGGISHGPGSTCSQIACPQACCLPNGDCQDISPADCDNQGGRPLGPGSTCDTNAYECPPQACCLPGEDCQDISPAQCADLGGTALGQNSNCIENAHECPQACCMPDGECFDMLPGDCDNQGGRLLGQRSNCSENALDCLPACCLLSGDCIEASPVDCENQGGRSFEPGTKCAPNPCPGPLTEACCLPDDRCIDVSPDDCKNQGGQSQGPGTICTGLDCSGGGPPLQ